MEEDTYQQDTQEESEEEEKRRVKRWELRMRNDVIVYLVPRPSIILQQFSCKRCNDQFSIAKFNFESKKAILI